MRALSFYPDIRMLRLTRRELETEPTGQPRQLSTLPRLMNPSAHLFVLALPEAMKVGRHLLMAAIIVSFGIDRSRTGES
jgi:hypothetical protein